LAAGSGARKRAFEFPRINDWVVMRDEFEEGGYKQSGRGRLRGLAQLEDFVEYKHIVLQPGIVASC